MPPPPSSLVFNPPFVEKSIFKERNNLYSWSHFKNKWNSFIIHAIIPPLVSEHFCHLCVLNDFPGGDPALLVDAGSVQCWTRNCCCLRQVFVTHLSPDHPTRCFHPLESTSATWLHISQQGFSPLLTQLKLTPCNFSLSLQILQPVNCQPIISTHCLC